MPTHPSKIRARPRNAARRGFGAAVLAVVGACLLGCAAGSAPEPAVQIDDADIELARRWYADTERKFEPYADAETQRYVQRVGDRLVRVAPRTNLTFRFVVLDSPGTFAYSYADGSVVVSRGLITAMSSEAQLAAVLGHEIGHVVSRHQARIMREAERAQELEAKLAARFATEPAREVVSALSLAHVRGYSREHEVEADTWSERLLARAGYDPAAATQALRFFTEEDAFFDAVGPELFEIPESGGGQGVLATHPSSAARLQMSLDRVGAAAAAAPDAAYLNRIRGMLYGLPERYGVQRGRRYMNPEWRIGFTVPADWYLFGADGRLVAASRKFEGLIYIRAEARASKEPVHRALEILASGQTLEPAETLSLQSGKGETALAYSTGGKDSRPSRLAVLDVGERRLLFAGFALGSTPWADADARIRALLASARPLTAAEAAAVKPLRVQIERADGRGRYTPFPGVFADHAEERWELLNQLYPKARPAPGQWIKTVR